MAAVESSLTNDEDIRRRQQLDKDISSLESKKSRMTDMLFDGTILKESIRFSVATKKNSLYKR